MCAFLKSRRHVSVNRSRHHGTRLDDPRSELHLRRSGQRFELASSLLAPVETTLKYLCAVKGGTVAADLPSANLSRPLSLVSD